MIRITLLESAGHVLYTQNSDYEVENVSRICSFLTSPHALKELQTRKERVVYAGEMSRLIRPCNPNEWIDHETYESMKRMLQGHGLPVEGRFFYNELVEETGAKIPLQFVHDAYCLFCERIKHTPLPIKRFGKVLRDHYGAVTRQTTYKSRSVTCLINYKLL
jgi:hypothetical protein